MVSRFWTRFYGIFLSVAGLFFLLSGCESNSGPLSDPSVVEGKPGAGGTSYSPSTASPYPKPTSGVTAPALFSPTSGSEVTQSQPTLVVSNSTTDDVPSLVYIFQIAQDAEFTEIVSLADGIVQGGNGRTEWQVPQSLEQGQYFWRARARSGLIRSPFSDTADFTVAASAPPPNGSELVLDSLLDGTSVGEVNGGSFTAEGWKVTSQADFIRYEIPSLVSGYVEWDNAGLSPANPGGDQFMLFGMWDPRRGPYRANPFRVHIQKLDTVHNPPYVRLRWISDGEQHDKGYDFREWNPQNTYRWRLEWGPEGNGNVARLYLDGQSIVEVRYSRTYHPLLHWVELGIAERRESIVGTIYSNVRIGTR